MLRKNYQCQLLADITFACFTTIVPIVLMFIFGLLTIFNVQQSQRRILQVPTIEDRLKVVNGNELSNQTKKGDRSLFRMLCVQIFIFGILTLPQAIQRLYAVTVHPSYSQLQSTIDMFIYNIVLLLTYLASAMQFYILTLTGGKLFRQALTDLLRSIFTLRGLCCQ
ncbi:unnamed protein product [Adineta ricciae]|uniref:G-protein coupled receptors family 1 profile domain-containing protein n=1 Tax=Adineta ricciae TaxID=249248 RepID=A0A815T246_ADIRI|nr:unnamed protein product [Adineta ricciae]CAF1499558.1 unnamed protein product [Adineta ricciae]